MVLIIGYQGTEGSNNHAAAHYFAEKYGWQESQLRPLVTGKNLLAAMKRGEVHYGVFAHSAAAGGKVAENAETFGDTVKILDRYTVDVHHYLFGKTPLESVTAVASHPEALRECRKTLKTLCHGCEEVFMPNTGTAAHALAEGKLPDTTAVICSVELGEKFGLTLLRERVEDLTHNFTTFVLVELNS